ncbi:MAG: Ig-like domain-containing protein [Prevotella sp.]|nr:Ig-like domain-containing protein [Prevotella sp.]
MCKAKVVTSTEAKITWAKVKGAQRYVVYFANCGRAGTKKIGMTSNLSYNKASLKKGEAYKFKILAQRKIGGKWKTISTGFLGHFAAGNLTADKKYTNPKSLSVAKDTVTIKKGKTSQIKPSVTPVKAGKELLKKNHNVEIFRYMSSNTAIATVSSSGKITAIKKGTCKVYVVAPNGLWKEISVTVK